ncbi:MAG: UDP-N-acetylmuramoylalanine--D-glutamate ligase [Parcubacteria group bacterium LiPW_39]|nr:MAG: UDP-N-acetylmuramoylalanine--D-glutamate ligase [Parcubacteria group bacterium LiPW_39]
MELKDFKDKRITVMGIGLHGGGVGVIKFLAAQGAKILATDLRNKEQLKESLEKLAGLPVEYVLGEHRLRDFAETEMVIKNPGVPEDSEFLKAAGDKNIPVESDIGIFFELCPAPIIGITGTKGKSTTAAILAQILSTQFPQVILAGNIRQSVLEKLPEITKDTIVVLELSSWQLADAKEHKKSPYVAVMTNILNDHLNRYAGFQDYIEDKKLIFKFQKDKDYLFLNYTDPVLKNTAKEAISRIYFYSADGETLLKDDLPKLNQKARLGAYRQGKNIYYGAAKEKICALRDIKLIGEHNLNNVLAAISVADLYNVPREKIKTVLRQFKGLEGRLQFIKQVAGVKYINDTAATAPDAAMAAIKTVFEQLNMENKKGGIILIAGGADKNLNFSPLANTIAQKCRAVVLLTGTATDKLEKEIDWRLPIKKVNNMEKAVALAAKAAKPADIVLLSPGCASFGLFRHEFERGEAFNKAIASLKIKN